MDYEKLDTEAKQGVLNDRLTALEIEHYQLTIDLQGIAGNATLDAEAKQAQSDAKNVRLKELESLIGALRVEDGKV